MVRRRVNVSRSVTESGGLIWGTPKTWERRSVPFPAVLVDGLAALHHPRPAVETDSVPPPLGSSVSRRHPADNPPLLMRHEG